MHRVSDDNNQDLGTWKAPSKGFFTPLNVAVIFACCIPMGITGAMLTRGAKPPRAIADAPAFKLTNQRGEVVSKDSLKGKVWVGSFLFTHCPDVCPRTLQRLKGVTGWLAERRPEHQGKVRMIGISLDHRGDTPERAEAFLTRQGHDSKQWDYLLSKESLHPLMRDGFMLGVREGQNGLAAAHADRVVLVGKAGRIRGYYDLSANEGIAQLNSHIDLLVNETIDP
jgi:protein SCO1/2